MVRMKRLQGLRMNGGYVVLHWRPNRVPSCSPKSVRAPLYGVVWWFYYFLQSCVIFLHKTVRVRVFSENQNCVWTLSCGCGDFLKWLVAVSTWWLSFTNRASSLLKNQAFFLLHEWHPSQEICSLGDAWCSPMQIVYPRLKHDCLRSCRNC